jgi:diguanylate cyclase
LEQEHWERKYHLALERLEQDEYAFRALETCLRRLVSRVAILAHGRDGDTDRLLDRLAEAMRQSATEDVLDPLLTLLGEAVARFDPDTRQATAAPAVDSDRGAEALRQLLLRIVLIPVLAERAVDLRAALVEARDEATVNALAGQIADLINRQRDYLRENMARLEGLLREVGGRLDEMSRYLASELEEQDANIVESRQLDSTVRREMQLLGQQTRDADALSTLKAHVNSRLAFIDQHFKEYREREDARVAAYRDRAEYMRSRVEELESQATSLEDSLRREHERALTDPLTGMPNRLAFEQHIDDGYRLWLDGRRPLCVAAFDIDHFKQINDSYGHAAGDAVLRIVGQALMGQSSPEIFVSRHGGEEFAVVFGGMELAQAMLAADRLRSTVEALGFHASARSVKVTMSGGVARLEDGDTPSSTLERADKALYAAKRAGRNRCMSAVGPYIDMAR